MPILKRTVESSWIPPSYYEVLLFLHISAAVLWLGGGTLTQVLALRATRERNADGLRQLFSDLNWAADRYYIPSSLAVLVFGILLTIEGPWSFSTLWIVLGLAGYAFTFGTGILVIKPAGKRIAAMIERDGGVSAAVENEIQKLFLHSRPDLAVLFMVVANMALKPTGDDLGTLVAMAAVIDGVTAYSIYRSRSLGTEGAPAAAFEE
jgi:uncharacterized membrane protein